MNKLKILCLLPVLALAACGGKGGEVTEEKAKEIATNVSAETAKVKSLDFTCELSMYDAEKKESTKSNYEYKFNEKGELFASSSGQGSQANEKSGAEFYLVKDEEYEEVMFYHVWDKVSGESYTVYTKKGNEITYAAMSATLSTTAILSVSAIYEGVNNPLLIIADAKSDDTIENKYYSSGDKNLTIEVTAKAGASDEDGKIKSGSATYTYDNNLLSEFKSDAEYENGNKMNIKGNAKYASTYKISLPSDWKDHMKA